MADKPKMNRRGFLRHGLTLGGAAVAGGAVALNASTMWEAASEVVNGPKVPINGVGLDDHQYPTRLLGYARQAVFGDVLHGRNSGARQSDAWQPFAVCKREHDVGVTQ